MRKALHAGTCCVLWERRIYNKLVCVSLKALYFEGAKVLLFRFMGKKPDVFMIFFS